VNRTKYPFANQKQDFNDVSLEFGEDERPLAMTSTDFLSISQIPNTNSLRVDLFLPKYIPETLEIQEKERFSIIFEYDVLQRIHQIFEEYEDIVAFTDGSS
jgi:hypothetical protein